MTLIQIVNMNERIKELAEQCGFKSNPDIYDRNQSFDIPKFAELIVQECIEQVVTGPNGPAHYAVEAALRLKKHFGVEV
jgi:hypothetical protein